MDLIEQYKDISLPTILPVTPIEPPSWLSTEIKAEFGCDMPDTGNYMFISDCTYGDFTIPYGFITDFASTGSLSPAKIKDTGRKISAYHDYWYRTARVSKDTADELFKQGLNKYGTITSAEAYIFYEAVHIFGDSSYMGQNANLTDDHISHFFHSLYTKYTASAPYQVGN